ncbi:MAG: alcohol dehydrogenase catalytic domain-containing protein [Limnochordales bacterium]|nr:alcohol dehydrogenase catalytic domain-containing protein [Limnochordales bacterium]
MLPERMRAVRFYGPGDLRAEDVPLPTLAPGDLLVRVGAAGICATDRKILARGHFKIAPGSGPRILGHEVVGQVAAVAGDGTGFQVGQRVAIGPNIGCSRCPHCLVGDVQLCPDYEAFGISLDGGMAEYMRVPARAVRAGNVIPLPPGLGYAEAALFEPLACCYNSLAACRLEPGETLVVVGAGSMGLMHVVMGRALGAGRILLVGRTRERLERGLALGADGVLQDGAAHLDAQVQEWTGGRGADVVVVTVPAADLASRAVAWAARKGRVNLFAGFPAGQDAVAVPGNHVHYGQVTVTGTTGASLVQLRRVLDLLAAGRLDAARLATGRFSLDEAERAFAEAGRARHIRVQLVPGGMDSEATEDRGRDQG